MRTEYEAVTAAGKTVFTSPDADIARAWVAARKRVHLRIPTHEKLARFAQVDPATGCHNWTRYCDPKGYGWITTEAGERSVHRVAYELARGPIPHGLVIDHLCRNRRCCNPDHLEAVTNQENLRRGFGVSALNARKTHCKSGHEFTPENTAPSSRGGRRCRACDTEWHRNKYGHKARVYETCLRGHPFDDLNTYHSGGRRHCRACRASTMREHRAQSKAAGAAL